jgi:hypothetical protein
MAAGLVALILMLAGVRAILAPTPEPVVVKRVTTRAPDTAAITFAEQFARQYLTWTPDEDSQTRDQRLAPYLGDGLQADAGLSPGDEDRQEVFWTAVVGTQSDGKPGTVVTVSAETNHGRIFLAVPVHRDDRGFLGVTGPPALVGGAPGRARLPEQDQPDVTQGDAKVVVTRAITNYLTGNQRNLTADLTPGAVVTLPPLRLRVTSTDNVVWVQPERRIALDVDAIDDRGTQWTLRYELDVVHSGRWYVQSIHTNPIGRRGR